MRSNRLLLSNRKRALAMRRAVVRRRRHLAERFGSDRFSHPSRHGIDRELERLFAGAPAFFVEAGGADGYRQSNTYYLERFCGWNGVLIEPIPELYRRCRRDRERSRVFNAALVADETSTPLVPMRFGDLMSVVAGSKGNTEDEYVTHGLRRGGVVMHPTYQIDVPGRTLTSVLLEASAPEYPDLLSLDIEGWEVEALKGLDLFRFRFRYILVELASDEHRRNIDSLLGDAYEPAGMLSHHDALYRRSASRSRVRTEAR